MLKDADRPDFPMHQFTDVIAPHECHHHHHQQFADPFRVGEVCVLHVEACALHRLEHRLYLPAPPVGSNTVLRLVV